MLFGDRIGWFAGCAFIVAGAAVLVRLNKKKTRHCRTCACKCRKFVARVHVRENTPSAVCFCDDCKEYAKLTGIGFTATTTSPAGTVVGGPNVASVYQKDFEVVYGGENLQQTFLRKGSPLIRVETTCCNTPMFYCYDSTFFPFVLITADNLDDPSCFYPPTYVLYAGRVWKDHKYPQDENNYCTTVPFSFIGRLIGRFLYGTITRKASPDLYALVKSSEPKYWHGQK